MSNSAIDSRLVVDWPLHDIGKLRDRIRRSPLRQGGLFAHQKLVTLSQMLSFYAAMFVAMLSNLNRIRCQIYVAKEVEPFSDMLTSVLIETKRELNRAELRGLNEQIERFIERIEVGELHHESATTLIRELESNIAEEFTKHCFLLIPAQDRAIFERILFSSQALDKFPSAEFDIAEAGKCYGLDRHTACVYHLMRVLETGLRSMAEALNAFDPQNPSWENIIGRCERAVRNLPNDPNRSPDWRDDRRFYNEAAVDFRHFKDAWRNYVAHEREQYTKARAADIFSHVKSFMEHLSTRLSEPGV